MKLVTVGNESYLVAKVTNKDGAMTLAEAYSLSGKVPEVAVSSFGFYLKKKLKGELITLNVTGGVATSVRDLSEKEKIILDDLQNKMQLAKDLAMPRLIERTFADIAGV